MYPLGILNQLKINNMDTTTVLAIIEMIENQRSDIRAMINETRPWELRDSQWIFKCEKVGYGADTALRNLAYHLQEYIEYQVNQAENNLGGSE